MKLTWNDTDPIAWQLVDNNPGLNPLSLSFSRLHDMVVALPDFEDDPNASNEAILEAIQMAWYDEVK